MVEISIGTTGSDTKVVSKGFTNYKSVSCRIKGNCDTLNPTFIVNADNNYVKCNYVYCSTWGKYYFIKNVTVSEAGSMEINCHVDVLTTYRNAIYGSNQYVSRCSTDYNLSIPDNLLPLSVTEVPKVTRFGIGNLKTTESYVVGLTACQRINEAPTIVTSETEENKP